MDSKHRLNGKILYQYLLYFLLVLSIPVLAMGISYTKVVDLLRQNTSQQNLTALQTSAVTIEQVVDDVNNVIYYISNNTDITRFLQLKPLEIDKTIVSDILKAQKHLKSYIIANSYIKEIQLYGFQSRVLVDSATNVLDLERYYQAFFEIDGVSYSQWKENYLTAPHAAQIYPAEQMYFRNDRSECLLYAQTIPVVKSTIFGGNVFCFLDEKQLLSQFQSVQYSQGGMVCVLDETGNIIFSDNPGQLDLSELDRQQLSQTQGTFQQTMGGEKMLVSYLQSSHYNWTYLSILPQQTILAPSQDIRDFLIGVILISLLVSGILAFYSAVKTAKPVISISNLLIKNNPTLSPKQLSGEIAHLMQNNENMQTVIQQQMNDQRAALFYSLLSGGFRDESEIRQSFSKFHITLKLPHYCILLVTLTDWEINSPLPEISAYKKLLKEVLNERIPGTIGICDLDLKRSLLLTGIPENQLESFKRDLEKCARDIYIQFSQAMQSSISFAACTTDNLMKIPAAFFLLQTSDIILDGDEVFHWFSQLEEVRHNAFYYPLNLEIRLISAVQEGRFTMVEEIFELIARQNSQFLSSHRSSNTGSQLIQALYGTLMRLINECHKNKEDLISRSQMIFEGEKDILAKELFQRIRECYLMVTDTYDEKESTRGELLRQNIQEYVNTHFADPQISLSSVADAFHITESYLSRIFKQETGENFSKYVEKLRVEKAQELIETKQLTFSEVAEKVGYNSPQVFRRAYKRVCGMSPSENTLKHIDNT
ncbi:MAG: AraC family transcriptional regulator [Candidatus Merdivicinus sp.]